jgi:hypothetical protein
MSMHLPPMFFDNIHVAANVRTLSFVQLALHTVRVHRQTFYGFFDIFGYFEFAGKSRDTMPLLDLVRNHYGLLFGHPVLPICQMTHYLPRLYRISTFLAYDCLPLGQMLKMAACHYFAPGAVYVRFDCSVPLC